MSIWDRIIDCKLQFEPRDLWLGIYWNVRPSLTEYDRVKGCYIQYRVLIVYVCILPTLPIKIRIII